jgi:hypothetical protein
MDPDARTGVLAVGFTFCVFLLILTLGVVADSGLDILSVISFIVIALIAIGLLGAIREPPDR